MLAIWRLEFSSFYKTSFGHLEASRLTYCWSLSWEFLHILLAQVEVLCCKAAGLRIFGNEFQPQWKFCGIAECLNALAYWALLSQHHLQEFEIITGIPSSTACFKVILKCPLGLPIYAVSSLGEFTIWSWRSFSTLRLYYLSLLVPYNFVLYFWWNVLWCL